jgi:triosephosphate isomerase
LGQGRMRMAYVFVNLKRFDIPRDRGGICPDNEPESWIRSVVHKTVDLGLGRMEGLTLTYLLPESLLLPALEELRRANAGDARFLSIGCQSVFREDVEPGGNFGAFTTNFPAAAAVNVGASWAMIGHSEERKDKLGIMSAYDPEIEEQQPRMEKAMTAVGSLINREAVCALRAGLNVLLCIGETAEQRGGGSFEEQKPRIEKSLRSQIEVSLRGVKDHIAERQVVIGYEPIWAIGPGKTPPGPEYIGFVARSIKKVMDRIHGFTPAVVYGGGLKKENAGPIGRIPSVDGGLVALTRFTQPIGFTPEDLKVIADTYMASEEKN